MSTQQPINRMKKGELLNLIEDALANINRINSSAEVFSEIETKIKDAYVQISGDEGYLVEIRAAASDAEEKSTSISETFSEMCEDDEDGDSVGTQLRNLVAEIEEDKNEIDDFKKQIFGFSKTNNSGELENIPGLFDNINSFHNRQTEKYDELYKRIEDELASGATTVNLSKSFADKVSEYRLNSRNWSLAFVILIGIMVAYYAIATFSTKGLNTVQDVFLHLSYRAPFLALAVWLGAFFGNRRAESKKLEESYKHKEVMARSFTGYKRLLEDIDESDAVLLREHMTNLLRAISKDSGDFLEPKGEKYPLLNAIPGNSRSRKTE